MGNIIGSQPNLDEGVKKLIEHLSNQDLSKIDVSKIEVENLVLEGGGVKGLAYCGLFKALDQLGIFNKIKRYAGTSIGSIFSIFAAIGCSADTIIEMMISDGNDIMPECRKITFLRNLLNKMGWDDGKRGENYLRKVINDNVGDPDITFKQLYQKTGKELCIVVTNVSSMTAEYCHVKTTPDMPIYKACIMSMALPVLFQPVRYAHEVNEMPELFADGGILDNYPLFVYDGWYLNMKTEYSFLHMIDKKEPPFDELNKKTLGATLFDVEEPEIFKENLLINKDELPERPDTKLSRSRKSELVSIDEIVAKRSEVADAAKSFLSLLSKHDNNKDGTVGLAEFTDALKMENSTFTDEQWQALFGNEKNVDAMFSDIDINHDGQVSLEEIVWFVQKKGVTLLDANKAVFRVKPVDGLGDYLGSVVNAIQLNTRRKNEKPGDAKRTIPLFTDYIRTSDFPLEHQDFVYIIKLGFLSTMSFLKDRCQSK